MKMRFKIGDVVFIKTRTEICNIMDSNDCIGDCHFANDMFNHCGLTLTIDQIDDIQGVYRMKEDPWHLYNDDMISHLYEEKDSPRFAVGDKVILDPWPCEVINVRYIKEKSRFLYAVKGIDFSKLVTADMLEIDASEYPKYNVGDVVGVYGYETDVVIADVRKEGSSFAYKVYLADEEEWIYDSDIAYRGDVAKAVSSMESNKDPLFKPDDTVETNDNLIGTVDRSWWDEKENCYVYEVSFAHVDFGIYKEKHLKPYVKKTNNTNNKPDACRSCFTPFLSTQCLIKDCPHNKQIKDIMNMSDKATDNMIEGLVEDGKKETIVDYVKESNDRYRIVVDDRFDIEVDEGEYYAVRRKKEYPKTYEECCEIVGGLADYVWSGYKQDLFQTFHMLYICRDAYLKLYSEENGLEKPWSPDRCTIVYGICREEGCIIKYGDCWGDTCVLEFPTRELRDIFYENFKTDIERCKELVYMFNKKKIEVIRIF